MDLIAVSAIIAGLVAVPAITAVVVRRLRSRGFFKSELWRDYLEGRGEETHRRQKTR